MTETTAPFVPAPTSEPRAALAQFHSLMKDFLQAQERIMVAALSGMAEDALPTELVTPRHAVLDAAEDRARPALAAKAPGPSADPSGERLLPRQVPVLRAQSIEHLPDVLPPGHRVLVRAADEPLDRAVVAALAQAGAMPIRLPTGAGHGPDARADSSLDTWLSALDPDQRPQALVWLARPRIEDFHALDLCLMATKPHLAEAGRVVVALAAGGGLGRVGPAAVPAAVPSVVPPAAPSATTAGLAGFVEALAREWPRAQVKMVDLDPAEDVAAQARHLVQELSVAAGGPLVAYAGGKRHVLRHQPASLSPPLQPAATEPAASEAAGWVVLATGGPGGPAAAALAGLARHGCRGILTHSKTLPLTDVPWPRGILPLPARDDDDLAALARQVRARHGRLDLILHAPEPPKAGGSDPDTLALRLAADLGPLAALDEADDPPATGLVLLLSEGGQPQRCRAASLSALKGLAWDLSRRWGPEVAVKAITLPPPAAANDGARDAWPGLADHVLKDLLWSPRDEVESRIAPLVAPAHPLPEVPPVPGREPLGSPMVLLRQAWRSGPDRLTWVFDLDSAPYVDHHRFDGVAVMPIAVMMQMLMELPRAFGERRIVTGLRHIQLYQGLTLAQGPMELDFVLEDERPGGLRRASVYSRAAPLRPHYRADLILGDRLPRGAEVMPRLDPGRVWDGPDIATVYRHWLAHGPVFQTLDRLAVLTDRLVLAQARGTRPSDFLDLPASVAWDVDPGVADALLQAIWTWARVKQGASALPVGVKGLRRYDGDTTEGPLTAECRILSRIEDSHCVADLLVYDGRGRLCFLVDHFIGQSSPRLNRLGGGWQGGERR